MVRVSRLRFRLRVVVNVLFTDAPPQQLAGRGVYKIDRQRAHDRFVDVPRTQAIWVHPTVTVRSPSVAVSAVPRPSAPAGTVQRVFLCEGSRQADVDARIDIVVPHTAT